MFRSMLHKLALISRPSSALTRHARLCRPALEELESRIVPTFALAIQGGVLTAVSNSAINPDTITLDHEVINGQGFAVLNGQSFSDASYNSIEIGGTLENDGGIVANIHGNVKPLRVIGDSITLMDVVNLGNGGNQQGIQAAVQLDNFQGLNKVNINDGADPANHPDVRLTGMSLTGLAPAAINFGFATLGGLTITGGTGNTTYTVATSLADSADPVVLSTGSGDDTVNVLETGTASPLTVNVAGRGNDVVNVGNGASIAGIAGTLRINNIGSFSHLNINNGADTTPSHPNVVLSDAGLTGLAPADIFFQESSLDGLTVTGGNGNNTWILINISGSGTPARNPITLNTGNVHDIVNVQATEAIAPLTVNTGNPLNNDVVNVGKGSRLSEIFGPVTINNAHGGLKDPW
jgi:hypothetical protein